MFTHPSRNSKQAIPFSSLQPLLVFHLMVPPNGVCTELVVTVVTVLATESCLSQLQLYHSRWFRKIKSSPFPKTSAWSQSLQSAALLRHHGNQPLYLDSVLQGWIQVGLRHRRLPSRSRAHTAMLARCSGIFTVKTIVAA